MINWPHAVPCLEFLAFHSQRRSRRGRRAHHEGMAAAARGRAHGDRVGGVGARRSGRGAAGRAGAAEAGGGVAVLALRASLPGL